MSIKFYNYTNQHGFTEDYLKVYDFLKRINPEKCNNAQFSMG